MSLIPTDPPSSSSSSSSTPAITTTAGYWHHPIHTAGAATQWLFRGYGFLYFEFLKNNHIFIKTWPQPSDPAASLRPLKCCFINSWLNTNGKGSLSEIPTLKCCFVDLSGRHWVSMSGQFVHRHILSVGRWSAGWTLRLSSQIICFWFRTFLHLLGLTFCFPAGLIILMKQKK